MSQAAAFSFPEIYKIIVCKWLYMAVKGQICVWTDNIKRFAR